MNAKLKLLLMSTVSGLVLSLSGCAPECQDKFDCASKGANYTCSAGKCVQGAATGGGDGTTGGGSGVSGGGTGTTGGGSATGGGDGTIGGGTAVTGGGDGTTGGGTAVTGGGDGTTGGGTAVTGGGDGTTGGGTAVTGGGDGTTGGGTAVTGGGDGTTGGGTAVTGGGVGTTGGGTAVTGGGVGTTGGGTAVTGGGVGTTGGGTAVTGGGVGTTGGGTATTGGGTGACTEITLEPFTLWDADGTQSEYDAFFTPEIGDTSIPDTLGLLFQATASGTVDLATNADVALVVWGDDGAHFYFGTAGTLNITSGDVLNGSLTGTLTNATIQELDSNDNPIPGSCLHITSASINVTAPVDAGVPDSGVADSGVVDAGVVDAGAPVDAGTVDEQITQVRTDATNGSTSTVTIRGAVITYVKPYVAASALADGGVGNDPAGFFIQGTVGGPAIFVALNPATLVGGPYEVGDSVDITVSTVGLNSGIRQITGITSIVRQSSGFSIAPTDVSTLALFNTGVLDSVESKYVTLSATVTGAASASGTGYSGFPISTTGTTDGGTQSFVLRVPTTLRDAIEPTQLFGTGCTFTVNAPMWRYTAGAANRAEPSVWNQNEINIVSCPAPTVTSAVATSVSTVNVNFSRNINATSVSAAGFTLDNGATVVDAGLTGAAQVTLQTSTFTSGTTYTVTASSSVTDMRGTGVGTPNSATFSYSANACAAGDIVISAVFSGGGSSNATYNTDFVELHNRTNTAINLSGLAIQYAAAANAWSATTGVNALTGTIPANGYFLLCGATGGSGSGTLPTACDQSVGGALAIQANNAKIALVSSTAPLTGATCNTAAALDIIGFGTASCGAGTVLGALSTTTMARRSNSGCTDTNNNASDFSVVAASAPTNAASGTVFACTCP